jgi:Transposase C of IS166 homeodomain
MIAPMNSPSTVRVLSRAEAATLAPEQVVGLSETAVNLSRELASAVRQAEEFKHQLEWFKRQLFGQKSERRIQEVASTQMSLGEAIGAGESRGVPAGRSNRVRSVLYTMKNCGHEIHGTH